VAHEAAPAEEEEGAAGEAAVAEASPTENEYQVGPERYGSPRNRMPSNSRHEGSTFVSMTCPGRNARHVIGCHITQETRIRKIRVCDAEGKICVSLSCVGHGRVQDDEEVEAMDLREVRRALEEGVRNRYAFVTCNFKISFQQPSVNATLTSGKQAGDEVRR